MGRHVGAPVATLLALAISACGGGAPQGQASPAATSAAVPAASPAPSATAESLTARLDRLYAAAKAEGTVALYSSMNNDDAKKVLPEFQKRFPGVKVEHTRKTGEQLTQQIVTEKRAGKDLFDVFNTATFEVKFIIDQGYTQPYKVASFDDFDADSRDPNGAWIADRFVVLAIGFNTSKGIKPGDIKGWQDLCDKKYEGRIGVESSDVAVYSALKKGLGAAEADRIVKCVAANKPSLRSGHTETDNLLAAGEFATTFASHTHRLAQLKYEQNGPVDWVKDLVIVDMGISALAAKPPHPNAAKLWLEWLSSPDGQAAVAATGRAPASLKAKLKYPDVLGDKRVYIGPALAADYDKDSDFWRTTFGIK